MGPLSQMSYPQRGFSSPSFNRSGGRRHSHTTPQSQPPASFDPSFLAFLDSTTPGISSYESIALSSVSSSTSPSSNLDFGTPSTGMSAAGPNLTTGNGNSANTDLTVDPHSSNYYYSPPSFTASQAGNPAYSSIGTIWDNPTIPCFFGPNLSENLLNSSFNPAPWSQYLDQAPVFPIQPLPLDSALFLPEANLDDSLASPEEICVASQVQELPSNSDTPLESVDAPLPSSPTLARHKRPLSPEPEPISSPRWEDHRQILEKLYVTENKRLEEVMEHMETEYGFKATKQVYKNKFNKWGLYKNIPAQVMEKVIRHHDQRLLAGKETRYVGPSDRKIDIGRFRKRKRKYNDMADLEGPLEELPEGIRAYTPEPVAMPLAQSTLMKQHEKLFHGLRKGLLSFKDMSVRVDPTILFSNRIYRGVEIVKCLELLRTAQGACNITSSTNLRQYLDAQIRKWMEDLREGEMLLLRLLIIAGNSGDIAEAELWHLFQALSTFPSERFPENHPVRKCFGLVYDIQQAHGTETTRAFLRENADRILEAVETVFGRNHPYALSCIMSSHIFSKLPEKRKKEILKELDSFENEGNKKLYERPQLVSMGNRLARYRFKLTGDVKVLEPIKKEAERRRSLTASDAPVLSWDSSELVFADTSQLVGNRYLRKAKTGNGIDMRRQSGIYMVQDARNIYCRLNQYADAIDCDATLISHSLDKGDKALQAIASKMLEQDLGMFEWHIMVEGSGSIADLADYDI